MGGPPPLRFVTLLAPVMEPVYRAVAQATGSAVGRAAELSAARDVGALERDGFDVAFVCSPVYLWLVDRDRPLAEAIAAPILSDPRFGGEARSCSEVIIRSGLRARRFTDLRGATLAYNEPWSFSGYGCVQLALAQAGQPKGFFGQVVEVGSHARSIRMVADGQVDAAAIDTQVLAIELREHPDLRRRVSVIDVLGPYPIQPVVAATHLEPRDRAAIASAVCSIHLDTAMAAPLGFGEVKRFDPAGDADYDAIRAAQRTVAESGTVGLGTERGTTAP